jgi:methylenetetrahydrofolate dehydrogenase(NAD+)/5,10-methenyltetrahydrofolate cyclohydrolase
LGQSAEISNIRIVTLRCTLSTLFLPSLTLTQIDGILVQLPLPPHIDEKTVCYSVTPEKDVDGFHFHNIGKYCAGEPEGALIPATPLGVLEIIKRCNIPTYGKNVCIAGRSKNIGMLN